MKTRSVLVSFPGYRFSVQTLLPNHRLAALAASLCEAGHTTHIADYGTASMLDRFFPRKAQTTAQGIADRILSDPTSGSLSTLTALWQLRGMDRSLRAQQESVAAEVASGIAKETGLDFVVVDINEPDDLKGTLALASRLRALKPEVRIAAVGTFAEHYADTLLRLTDVFDCISVQDADWSLARWAERLDRPDTWRLIPNLVYAQHGYIRPTPECVGLDLDALPAASYSPDVYPALSGDEKLRLPGIEVARSSVSEALPRTRSPRAVCDEAGRWIRESGIRAFRFLGPEGAASHVDALAYEILSRGQSLWYSRMGAVQGARAQSFAALKSSGCQAVTFDVATGSQMLLDDYYGRSYGVSETEALLAACKQSGIFTVTAFTYPCAMDDYHTRAETMRLVERTRPDAALAALPEFALAVRKGGAQHALDVTPDEYVRHVLSGRDRFATPLLKTGGGVYHREARSLSDVLRANDVILRELAGIGVSTALTADTALVARVCGYEGQEEDFNTLFRQRLFTGDAAGVSAAVARFNSRVATPANTVAFKPFTPVLAAVGN